MVVVSEILFAKPLHPPGGTALILLILDQEETEAKKMVYLGLAGYKPQLVPHSMQVILRNFLPRLARGFLRSSFASYQMQPSKINEVLIARKSCRRKLQLSDRRIDQLWLGEEMPTGLSQRGICSLEVGEPRSVKDLALETPPCLGKTRKGT